MAGSLKYFRYRSDAGVDYSINIDESNANATVGGVALCLPRTAAHPLLGGRTTKRYLLATLVSNPRIKRKFWVGNPAAIPQILAGSAMLAGVYPLSTDVAVAPVVWSISAYPNQAEAKKNRSFPKTQLTDVQQRRGHTF